MAQRNSVGVAAPQVVLLFNNEFSWMTQKEIRLSHRTCAPATDSAAVRVETVAASEKAAAYCTVLGVASLY
jgi:hypothetical protein